MKEYHKPTEMINNMRRLYGWNVVQENNQIKANEKKINNEVRIMVQQTSIQSYDLLRNSERLGNDQAIVYETITKNPYLTDREYCDLLDWQDTNRWKPRRNELLNMGMIESAG